MSRTFFAAALVAFTSATDIIYAPGQQNNVMVARSEYPMVFDFAIERENGGCGATMISDQMAITEAACVEYHEDYRQEFSLTVRLSDGELYSIKEIRGNECWNHFREEPFNQDLALITLDRPIPNAVEGVHYVKIWDDATMGDLVGQEFAIAGWGAAAEIQQGVDWHPTVLHRAYNVVNEVRDGMLIYTMDMRHQGGLEQEGFAHTGDGGIGALALYDGELYLIGVQSKRHGYDWGTEFELVTLNYHREWIEANLASLDTRISAWDVEPRWCPQFNGLYEQCIDTNVRADGSILIDQDGDDCAAYAHNPGFCGNYDTAEFNAGDLCCACGGGGERIEESGDDRGNESGNDGVEDNDDEIEINCQCQCDAGDDHTCWLGCYECLEDIFGSESEVGDEGEESEEEPPTPVGIECMDQCQPCTFEMIECWEECHECLDPHFDDNDSSMNTEVFSSGAKSKF